MISAKDKIYNIDIVVNEVKEQPQTYATILKEEVYSPTMQYILRRKINKLCKDGVIFKTTIPGTRYGQAILYCEPHKYKILVESSRIGVNVYYFFEYENLGKIYIKVTKYWQLDGTEWREKNEEKTFSQGSVLKFI